MNYYLQQEKISKDEMKSIIDILKKFDIESYSFCIGVEPKQSLIKLFNQYAIKLSSEEFEEPLLNELNQ